jgi:3-oxoacyl-(acyl-carrier-protein) synthase
MNHRVAITGLGVVSPLGHTVEQNWLRVARRESGITSVGFQGHGAFSHSRCGGITDFEPASLIVNKKLLKLMNREAQLAFIAAGRAIEHAAIVDRFDPERMGIFFGTGLTTGELDALVPIVENSVDPAGNFSYRLLGAHALAKCNPLLSFKILPNMALSYISIEQKIHGPNMAFNPWPGNTVQAILEAHRSIASGEIDSAVAGGCDSKTNYVSFLTLARAGLLSQTGCAQPFSTEASGMVPGEGAACIVLESFEHAERRDAVILAELCGGSCATDCTSPGLFSTDAGAAEEAMRAALADARATASEVDMICTSLNAHPVSDEIELSAIEHVFGHRLPALSATSEFTGDLVAAAPAYSLALTAYAFARNESLPVLPASPRHRSGTVPGTGVRRTALINAFAAGTTKASMVVRNVQ